MGEFPRDLDVGAVEALVEKYRAIKELGDAREARRSSGARSFPPSERAARKAAMRDLAARFPGALRELDAYDAERVLRRLAELEGVLAREPFAPLPWMGVVHAFHQTLAGILELRRSAQSQGVQPPRGGRPSTLAAQRVAAGHSVPVRHVWDSLLLR